MKYILKFMISLLLLVVSLVFTVAYSANLTRFFILHDDFTVLSSRLVCEKPFNNRCVKHYIVERPNGLSHDFITLGYEITPDGFSPGMKFKKMRYSFSFVLNNKSQTWFLRLTEIEYLVAGLLVLIAWLALGGPKSIYNALVLLDKKR